MSEGHQWCRDVPRDEAVRAAEDAAAVPEIQHRDLPEVVADLRERVARLEAAQATLGSGDEIARLTGGEQQPPRVWLTAEERDAVADASETLAMRGCGSERRSKILKSLLARETPPKVKVPSQPAEFTLRAWNLCVSRWIAAIRAAGGEVEE